jgi:predicted RNA-binding protein with RPS1 domain
MTEKILDWTVVILPTVLGIVGMLLSLKAPPEATHRKWRYAFILIGLAISALTFWQQSRSRDSHAVDLKAQQAEMLQLQKMVQGVDGRILRFALDFELRERDTGKVAAIQSAIHDYARREAEKRRLDNKQLSERTILLVRKMREFQLRFDYEQSEINRRFLDGLKKATTVGAAELVEVRKNSQPEKISTSLNNIEKRTELLSREQIDARRKQLALEREQLEAERKQTEEDFQKKLDVLNRRQEESRKVLDQSNQEEKELTERYAAEFRSSFLGEAAYVRDELLRRLSPQPPASTTLILTFQGVLISSQLIGSAADYLEILARKLSL